MNWVARNIDVKKLPAVTGWIFCILRKPVRFPEAIDKVVIIFASKCHGDLEIVNPAIHIRESESIQLNSLQVMTDFVCSASSDGGSDRRNYFLECSNICR